MFDGPSFSAGGAGVLPFVPRPPAGPAPSGQVPRQSDPSPAAPAATAASSQTSSGTATEDAAAAPFAARGPVFPVSGGNALQAQLSGLTASPTADSPGQSRDTATENAGTAVVNAIASAPLEGGSVSQAAIDSVSRRSGTDSSAAGELTDSERQVVSELRSRDREVRAHEQAHANVGGQYAGAPQYDFVTGPDGRRYAVSGSVSIDVSEVPNDPEATADKMEVVRRAALAPSEPSAQDRAVASEASSREREARAELARQQAEERRAALDGGDSDSPDSNTVAADAIGTEAGSLLENGADPTSAGFAEGENAANDGTSLPRASSVFEPGNAFADTDRGRVPASAVNGSDGGEDGLRTGPLLDLIA